MSTQNLHTSLLRAPVLHILRAAGFHSTRPSVLDTLVNITERYLLLLATTTAAHALSNHNTPEPSISDIRMALTDCGTLTPTLGSAEEEWRERLRRPLDEYDNMPFGAERRVKEIKRRNEEDTRDVVEFVAWITGDKNREIRRVAGLVGESGAEAEGTVTTQEDFLTALKKKHSKTGEEARFAGTVLGKMGEDRPIRIEGGEVESVEEWMARVREKGVKGGPVKKEKVLDTEEDEAMTDAPS